MHQHHDDFHTDSGEGMKLIYWLTSTLGLERKCLQNLPHFCSVISTLGRGKSVGSWCDGSLDLSFIVDSLSYFSNQPVLHNWCNKGCGMYYPVCGMVHIKQPLLLIKNSSPCDGSRFPLLLSEWSFTICPMPYNHKYNVLSASLNKTLPYFNT